MSDRPAEILIVEDTFTLLETYKAYLRQENLSVRGAETGQQALEQIEQLAPDVLVLDVNLPDMHGIDILKSIRANGISCEVIVITGQASVNLAVEAMREGAFDFIMKPFNAERIRTTVRNALERHNLSRQGDDLAGDTRQEAALEMITGQSSAMHAVFKMLRAVGPSTASVFIRGESGTGKELCAEAIHKLSRRSEGPFVVLNCAAIPKDLLESEIFGHVKGAFTGATSDRKGAALTADKGTLFLDEVCEMDLSLQSKLLRFLQEKKVQRVGEDRLRDADVRIVCATNRDPIAEVAAGRFREDLYYRLHVVPIDMPPLRQREGDVVLIARQLLEKYAKEEGKPFTGFSVEAKKALAAYDWPGNVRQLQNVVRSAVVLNHGEVMERFMLPPEIAEAKQLSRSATGDGSYQGQASGQGDQEGLPATEGLSAGGTSPYGYRPVRGSSAPQTAPFGEAPPYGRAAAGGTWSSTSPSDGNQGLVLPFQSALADESRILPLETVIRLTIEHAIDRCNGSIPRAAAALEVSPSTIYRRIQAWELEDRIAAQTNEEDHTEPDQNKSDAAKNG